MFMLFEVQTYGILYLVFTYLWTKIENSPETVSATLFLSLLELMFLFVIADDEYIKHKNFTLEIK